MLYIKGPRAGARQSRQCKDKRKYESASVQVPTDYNRLYIKPMIFFLQIMKMQLILLTTREHSACIVHP